MKKSRSYLIDFVLLSVLLLLSFVFSLCSGTSSVGLGEILRIVSGEEESSAFTMVFYDIRLPKALTAVLSGAALSVCGILMQTLFRNPLAGPYVLGINSGASLFAGIAITTTAGATTIAANISVPLFATAGAVFTLLLVLSASYKIRTNTTLLLAGIMLGFVYNAIQSVLEYLSNAGELRSFILWSMGSVSNVTWDHLSILSPVLVIGLALSLLLIKPLDLLLLGDAYAESSGVNLKKSKLFIILITGVLSGITVAYCGPVAFVGLAVPHVCRIIFQTSSHAVLLPACMLAGSSFLLLCDAAGRLFSETLILPLNVTTSLVGAPLVIWLLFKDKTVEN